MTHLPRPYTTTDYDPTYEDARMTEASINKVGLLLKDYYCIHGFDISFYVGCGFNGTAVMESERVDVAAAVKTKSTAIAY